MVLSSPKDFPGKLLTITRQHSIKWYILFPFREWMFKTCKSIRKTKVVFYCYKYAEQRMFNFLCVHSLTWETTNSYPTNRLQLSWQWLYLWLLYITQFLSYFPSVVLLNYVILIGWLSSVIWTRSQNANNGVCLSSRFSADFSTSCDSTVEVYCSSHNYKQKSQQTYGSISSTFLHCWFLSWCCTTWYRLLLCFDITRLDNLMNISWRNGQFSVF